MKDEQVTEKMRLARIISEDHYTNSQKISALLAYLNEYETSLIIHMIGGIIRLKHAQGWG